MQLAVGGHRWVDKASSSRHQGGAREQAGSHARKQTCECKCGCTRQSKQTVHVSSQGEPCVWRYACFHLTTSQQGLTSSSPHNKSFQGVCDNMP
eukprot:4852030-Heterocapsa_arctica.AAC.1